MGSIGCLHPMYCWCRHSCDIIILEFVAEVVILVPVQPGQRFSCHHPICPWAEAPYAMLGICKYSACRHWWWGMLFLLSLEPQVPQSHLMVGLWVCKYKTGFCHPSSSKYCLKGIPSFSASTIANFFLSPCLKASAHLSWGMGFGGELVDTLMMHRPSLFCALSGWYLQDALSWWLKFANESSDPTVTCYSDKL